jgi:hypothetical protein
VQERIQAAVNKATSQDATLYWTPTGMTIERMVRFRVQQPTRMSGRVPKTFQIQGVGADYRIISANMNSASVTGTTPLSLTVTNNGNEDADVKFQITGPFDASKLIIVNQTTGKQIQFLPNLIGVPAGSGVPAYASPYTQGQFYISTNAVTFQDYLGYNVSILEPNGNQDQYPYVDPLNTDWTIAVAPGSNTFELQANGTSAATAFEVMWYDSWI